MLNTIPLTKKMEHMNVEKTHNINQPQLNNTYKLSQQQNETKYMITQEPIDTKYTITQEPIDTKYTIIQEPLGNSYSLKKDELAVNTILKTDKSNINEFEKMELVQDEEKSTSEIVKAFRELGDTKNVFTNDAEYIQVTQMSKHQPLIDDSLSVTLNESSEKFTFYKGDKEIGYFTIEQLIKYLGHIYDTRNQFLINLIDKNYKDAKTIIKTFILKMKYDKMHDNHTFELIDYTCSGFMGDIELLIKLNNLLCKFQTERLKDELSKVDKDNSIKIERNILSFIYLLLNYTLKLISIMTETIKGDPTKELLLKNLVRYSIGLVYRISMFVQGQLSIIMDGSKKIEELIRTSNMVKEDMKLKLLELINSMNTKQSIPKQSQLQLKTQQNYPMVYVE